MWLLLTGKYSCVSGSIVDRWMLLQGGCCRRISIVVSLGSMVDKLMLL